jgi:hypothetical protein
VSVEDDGTAEKSDELAETSEELSEEYWLDRVVDAAAEASVEDGDSDSIDEMPSVKDWASEELSGRLVDAY